MLKWSNFSSLSLSFLISFLEACVSKLAITLLKLLKQSLMAHYYKLQYIATSIIVIGIATNVDKHIDTIVIIISEGNVKSN